jgi:hypothetical protein
MKKLTGSCLCGAVFFEVDDDFQQLNLCHCVQCQKATGSAHASNLFTEPGNIRWTKGADYVKRYDVPGRSISNAFCTECGSGLPYVSKTARSLIVQAGTLDNSISSNPVIRNIFCAERADWYDAASVAERHDTFPKRV